MSIDWTFGGSWPYAPLYHQSADGRMHYVDVGPRGAVPVVLLHGNPSWSYLYRHVIAALDEAEYRAVAIDHLGFGRSDKPEDRHVYELEHHADRLAGLLAALELTRAVLVVHDWAGPIALPWVVRNQARVGGVVLLNTFSPRLPGPMGARASIRAFKTPGLGGWLVRRRNVPVEQFLFKAGLSRPSRLTDQDKQAYRAPHPTPSTRMPLLMFPRQIPASRRHPVAKRAAVTAQLLPDSLREKPVALCWGMRDILFGEDVLASWSRLFPAATTTRLEQAGHFVPEDAPEEVRSVVLAVADQVAGSAAT